MLENLSDYISFGVMIAFVAFMLYLIFVILNRNHVLDMKRREDAYLAYLLDAEEDYTDSQSEDYDEY